ncbi:GAF domain-containing protein [Dactylosporangium cerinum]|uniref:GAF domain-containing protein n=1 Tax=Dactylosporangium cerinum TaxID=1434730 RepID=A0ABV9VPA7_9ACTN
MTTHAHDEDARLAALHSYGILDGPRPPALDELTRLASSIFDTPMSAVSLIDRDRQWFAGNTGLGDAETPLDVSFCVHAVRDRRQLVVPDARLDPHFGTYPNVTGDPHIRFYAGSPSSTRTATPSARCASSTTAPATSAPASARPWTPSPRRPWATSPCCAAGSCSPSSATSWPAPPSARRT